MLVKTMSGVTKCEPKMWGTAIAGFGTYHYTYASDHEGDAGLTGFASQKGGLSIHLFAVSP